jgi:hypothetical protein
MKSRVFKIALIMTVVMASCVTFQSFWIAQMNLPYVVRSLLVISNGMFVGYASTIFLILWIERDNPLD